jgi:sugar lactone lactonase YvrE
MNEPVGLAQSSHGTIYLTDTWNSRVQAFSTDLFAQNEWPVDAWNGTSINNKPYAAVDSAGRIYLTDPEGYRVLIFNPDGSYLARFGTFGTGISNLGLPNGIAIDGNDFLYVADSGNNRILKFAPVFGPVIGFDEENPGNEAISDEVEDAQEAEEENGAAPLEEDNLPTAAPSEED